MSLTVLVTSAGGRVYRLAADEPDAAWIPQNVQWTSTVPGGWKDCSFDLARAGNDDSPLRLFDEVVILDEAGQHVYEGRIMRLPRQIGDDFQQGVECLGWSSHLLDDTSFREIFIDQELGRWAEPSVNRRLASFAANTTYTGWSAGIGTDPGGFPVIAHSIADINQPGVVRLAAESWYDSAGVPIGELALEFFSQGLGGAASWRTQAFLSNDDFGSSTDVGVDHNGAVGPVAEILSSTTSNRRYAVLQTLFDASYTAGPIAGGWNAYWRQLAVYGQHGLPGTAPTSGGMAGFYIDQMLANAIGRAAPKLNFTVGAEGSVQRPPIVVTQAAYPDPGSVDTVILDLNKYVLWSWLVYENRTFFYRPTDPDRLTWECRIADGAKVSLEGEDAEKVVNGCMVKYTLVDGTRRVAGPPGSGFDVEDPGLVISDPEHVVNAHGYPRKWLELDISFPLGDDLYATTIGTSALAQASLPARSGSIELTGYANHPTKGLRPVREMRADDWVRVADFAADVPRRIVQTSYSEDDRRVQLSVGNEIDKVTAILEQVGVSTRLVTGG